MQSYYPKLIGPRPTVTQLQAWAKKLRRVLSTPRDTPARYRAGLNKIHSYRLSPVASGATSFLDNLDEVWGALALIQQNKDFEVGRE